MDPGIFRVILHAGSIPTGSTVTKVTGRKTYTLQDRIRIFEDGGARREISAAQGARFLVPTNGSGDVTTVRNGIDLCWHVSSEDLISHLHRTTHPVGSASRLPARSHPEASAISNAAIAERLGGAAVLQHAIDTDLDFVQALRNGFPVGAVDALLDHGGITAQEIYRIVMPERTLALRRQRDQPLTPEESDGLARIARVLTAAEASFGTPDPAYRWLRKPNRALAGEVPLDLLRTESGARLVEQAMEKITHGVFA